MITWHQEAPLVFLTTSTGNTPTGRNARAHARAEDARRTNPARARHGTFNTFSFSHSKLDTGEDYIRRLKRQKTRAHTESYNQQKRFELNKTKTVPAAPLRILATRFQQGGSPLPPNVNFEDVLRVAAFHIRRRAAHIVHSDPDRTLDALRCRQWCSVSATSASLGRSPFLDSAIAAVVSKVHQVILGASSQQGMLTSYTEALHCLRGAVLDPSQHDRLDMLAATQLLAIYEMLDFPENASWTQHVAGAAAMAKLQTSQAGETGQSNLQAGPMFVEALLNNDDSFFESPYWKSLLQILSSKTSARVEYACEQLSCFTSLRSVFAEHHAATQTGSELQDWSTRLPLLSRAHELRCRLKTLIISNEKRFTEVQKHNKCFDMLGLCLISVIMLDRLIITLRQDSHGRGLDLEEDTQGLCCQMVRMELSASEYHPGKELLVALQRQVSYPSLTYTT